MKEKRREATGKIITHTEGLGTVTRQMIEERSRELALIRGRNRPTREDRLQARRELLRMRGIREEVEELDEELDSLDPSETRSRPGHQAPNFEPDDEEQVQRSLVEQGIEEADHEQMVEGHLAMEEEEEEDLREDEGRAREG